jgi:nucleolar GTP-binding protein
VEFEKIPTVPTAGEILDRSLGRASAAKKEKRNKDRANEEFIRSVYSSVYDKLNDVVSKFPSFDQVSPFYMDIINILLSIDRIKKSLGAIQWAASQSREIGRMYARRMRSEENPAELRKQATARIASILYQVDSDLKYLNETRNVLRKLPDIREEEFTVVVAGYPNVGKSSFIALVSSAKPEIAGYAFTTKSIMVGHHPVGRERIQIVDTPGLLDRPHEKRNDVENQAVTAIKNVSDMVLFIVDASETCGYSVGEQFGLFENIKGIIGDTPVVVVINKSDVRKMDGYPNMSTNTREGISDVMKIILKERESSPRFRPQGIR